MRTNRNASDTAADPEFSSVCPTGIPGLNAGARSSTLCLVVGSTIEPALFSSARLGRKLFKMIGTMAAPIDLSYLADTVILTRHFEAEGHVRKAISVVKERTGVHESSIREYYIGEGGFRVGETLSHFRGILTEVPLPLRVSKSETG